MGKFYLPLPHWESPPTIENIGELYIPTTTWGLLTDYHMVEFPPTVYHIGNSHLTTTTWGIATYQLPHEKMSPTNYQTNTSNYRPNDRNPTCRVESRTVLEPSEGRLGIGGNLTLEYNLSILVLYGRFDCYSGRFAAANKKFIRYQNHHHHQRIITKCQSIIKCEI